MQQDDKASILIRRHEQLKSRRNGNWNRLWQDVKDYVNPHSPDFVRTVRPGKEMTQKVVDSTAGWALSEFAAAIQSNLINPTQRWFSLGTWDKTLHEDDEALTYLEDVVDRIYNVYALPVANHTQSVRQGCISLGDLGTSIVYQEWDDEEMCPVFRAFPLVQCCILENDKGFVDTVFREVPRTTRQAKQQFGKDKLPDCIVTCTDSEKEWKFIHAVFPRDEDERLDQVGGKGMRFASFWVSVDGKSIVSEGGYEEMPYHVARWDNIAGEEYGRSVAMLALPDIRMLNETAVIVLKAKQTMTNPPLQVPSDGFITPLDMTPGAINYREPGTEKAEPLLTGGRPELGDDVKKETKEQISRIFYTDLNQIPWKNERQTATEINERRDDQLRSMAPMLGRLMSEFLGPMVKRTYNLLLRHGMLPPAPASLRGKALKIVYVSPAAQAQKGSKLNDMKAFMTEDFMPMLQIDQSLAMTVDTNEYLRESALIRGVSRRILRSPEQVAQMKDQQAKQQQLAAMLQAGQSTASALKDTSVAAKNAPQLLGMSAS